MPFNPSLPAASSPLSSAEMRGQLTALNSDIQTRITVPDLNNALLGTSSNSNSVGTLSTSADSIYNQMQVQSLIDKVDELINALRR